MSADFNPIDDLRTALLHEKACEGHPVLAQSRTWAEADMWWETIQRCAAHNRTEHLRWFARNDLYFLLVHILNCKYLAGFDPLDPAAPQGELAADWYFARCKEVQAEPDNHIDLWSRGAGKSTIITFGKTIQDIVTDPNQTFGIFSHTKPIAKGFLRQIKTEFENNTLLKDIFSDILYQDPRKESPKWTEDEGFVVKRTANPKEATVSASGLTDGLPAGSHFGKLLYDDVIDDRAVNTPEMIDKTTHFWEQSLNLAASPKAPSFRVAGTFYAIGDTYHVMIERGFGTLRVRPVIVGTQSFLYTDDKVASLKQSFSPRMWALQILLDPRQSDKERGFKQEWLHHWKVKPALKSLNRYIFVDPGGKGEESTSYTAMVVVGLGADRHAYVLDIVKDRLSLLQRTDTLFQLHREYSPLHVYYERYSMQSDIEHIKDKQQQDNYRFSIIEVGAHGVQLSKERRIEKLQPDFANGLIHLPPYATIVRQMFDGKQRDMVAEFINNEYLPFPYTRQNDVFDALARMKDPAVNLTYPRGYGTREKNQAWRGDISGGGSWMSE